MEETKTFDALVDFLADYILKDVDLLEFEDLEEATESIQSQIMSAVPCALSRSINSKKLSLSLSFSDMYQIRNALTRVIVDFPSGSKVRDKWEDLRFRVCEQLKEQCHYFPV